MENTDLMIGDIVSVYAEGLQHPVTVEAKDFIENYKYFEPYEIDKTFLLKNGFSHIYGRLYTLDTEGHHIVFDCQDNSIEVYLVLKKDYYGRNTMMGRVSDVKYVHELQHFMKLCKVNFQFKYYE